MATKKPADSANGAAAPIKARVLVDCHLGKPDDVVEIDASEVDALKDIADTDPAAVAYAESLATPQ